MTEYGNIMAIVSQVITTFTWGHIFAARAKLTPFLSAIASVKSACNKIVY